MNIHSFIPGTEMTIFLFGKDSVFLFTSVKYYPYPKTLLIGFNQVDFFFKVWEFSSSKTEGYCFFFYSF